VSTDSSLDGLIRSLSLPHSTINRNGEPTMHFCEGTTGVAVAALRGVGRPFILSRSRSSFPPALPSSCDQGPAPLLRDDEAGGAFKSTRGADDNDNADVSRRTNKTPKGDEGGAYDSQRQSKAAPAQTPRTNTGTGGALPEAVLRGMWWAMATPSKASATTKARVDDDDDDEEGGSTHERPRDDEAGARSTGSEKATAPSGNPTPEAHGPTPDARHQMPDTRFPSCNPDMSIGRRWL
jgi:hypothetical protein